MMLLCLGIVDERTRLRDEHIAGGLAIAGLVWCAALVVLWWSYRKFARALRTAFIVLGLWAGTIPLCVMIEATTRNEYFITGVLFLAAALTIIIIAGSIYGASRGRPVMTKTGSVRVNCESCGYSMVGLSSTTCPECGHAPTIDQLIAAQDYAMEADAKPDRDEASDAAPSTQRDAHDLDDTGDFVPV